MGGAPVQSVPLYRTGIRRAQYPGEIGRTHVLHADVARADRRIGVRYRQRPVSYTHLTVTARGRGRAAAPGGVRLYESGLIQRDVRNQQVTGRSGQFRSRSIGCRAGTLFGCSDRRIRIRLL